MTPLVSVLINNYNYARFLRKCIDSVQNQTYENIEIIVHDDNSTDESLEILDELDGVVVIQSKQGKSRNNSVNQKRAIERAFAKSHGDFIFLLDSDDRFVLDKVQRIVGLYLENPDIISIQDAISNEVEGQNNLRLQTYFSNLKNFNAINYIKFTRCVFGLGPQTSGLSFRRDALAELISRYDETLYLLWPDIQLGRKALIENKALVLNESYTIRTLHKNNDSFKLNDLNYRNMFYTQFGEFLKIDLVKTDSKLDSVKLALSIFLYLSFYHGVNGTIRFFKKYLIR